MLNNLMQPMFYRLVTRYASFSRIINRLETFAKNNARTSVLISKYLINYRIKSLSLQLTSVSLALPFVVNAWGNKNSKTDEQKILEFADQLFDDSKFDQLMEILKSQPSWYDNCEVLWRVARCEFQLSKRDENKANTELVEEAYRHVEKALELNDQCGPAHKWAAILLNTVSTMKGTREKVEQVMNVRTHMEKAIKYSPNDPTAHYLLGEWHYSCNQVSWVERQLAAMIYGSLPEANLEVGLQVLEKAEQIESDFYSKNKVLLAKTLVSLNRDIERAKSLAISVISKYKNSDKWDDKEAVKEAKSLLQKLGVKITELK